MAPDEGWLYLAGIKDLFSGELVGYALDERIAGPAASCKHGKRYRCRLKSAFFRADFITRTALIELTMKRIIHP